MTSEFELYCQTTTFLHELALWLTMINYYSVIDLNVAELFTSRSSKECKSAPKSS